MKWKRGLKKYWGDIMKGKKKKSFQEEYMTTGMCLGMGLGGALGKFFSDNFVMGLSTGMCLGMGIGSLIGREKDKKLEKAQMLKEIEKDVLQNIKDDEK